MADAFGSMVGTKAAQATLAVLATILQLTSWRYPQDAMIQGNITVDYVVIGGGTAGSIVASRLTEDPACTVAVVEAGGDPPLESVFPGLFSFTPLARYDYNFPAENDHYTSRNVKRHRPGMTAGKMLGGTSSISHTLFLRGHSRDYDQWAQAAGDYTWNYAGLLPFFIKSERVDDEEVIQSSSGTNHGTNGNLGVLRQKNPVNDRYIEALQEIGFNYSEDVNSGNNLGVSYPYHLIADGVRQDGAESYLRPAKDRDNLAVYKRTTVTKILFDRGNNAIGVVAITSDKRYVNIFVKKEVILAAGVVKSPQLLMLSGIGPRKHLTKFKIPILSDLPVGKNLRDRVGVLLAYRMQESNENTPPMNPHKFPAPLTVGYKALNPNQTFPDYQTLNLVFSNDNRGLTMICSNVIKYENPICEELNKNNRGHELFAVAITSSHPASTGEILLKNKDPLSNPVVKLGHFSNPRDLDDMASYLLDFSKILYTTYFQKVGAEFVDFGFKKCRHDPKDSYEYWKCYALQMSSTFWQYCGTCSVGTVVDGKLRVRGVQRLRVVDASAVPSLNSGEILAAVVAFAEKAADIIKADKITFDYRS